jgi:Domain of unknown function (DUF4351)
VLKESQVTFLTLKFQSQNAFMIDHDGLFKKLLQEFFPEFIELFFPGLSNYWDKETITFLPQEVLVDVTQGSRRIIDLLVKVELKPNVEIKPKSQIFIIHIEHQSSAEDDFDKRIFKYFGRLYELYDVPIYPIVIYSHDSPVKQQPNSHTIEFPDFKVLTFNYKVIQLNQLHWQDFINQQNPVASAFMSKMQMETQQRPEVKLKALQLLSDLDLNPAQVDLVSGFIDTYLDLNTSEEREFQQQLANIEPRQEEKVMQIVTSWMRQGLEQGLEQGLQRGKQQEAASLIIRQLTRRVGLINQQLEENIRTLATSQLEDLGEALLDFTTVSDLENWLIANG